MRDVVKSEGVRSEDEILEECMSQACDQACDGRLCNQACSQACGSQTNPSQVAHDQISPNLSQQILTIQDNEEDQIPSLNHNSILETPLHLVYDIIKPITSVSLRKAIFYLSDLETLLPGRWLNDKVINFYFELLAEHHPAAYYFSTFAYQSISTRPLEQLSLDFGAVNFRPYATFFFPIHSHSHWSLIRVQDNVLTVFDSLGEVPLQALRAVRDFHAAVVARRRGISYLYRNGRAPRQTNGDDCGVFCCACAKRYVSAGVSSFSSKDIPRIRMEILHEILAGKILY